VRDAASSTKVGVRGLSPVLPALVEAHRHDNPDAVSTLGRTEAVSDLVRRLRDQGKDAFAKQYSLGMFKLCDEAADRIEALESARDVVEKKLRGLSAQWALHGGPFDHAWISEVMAAPEPDK